MSRIRKIVLAGALAFATAAPVVAEAGPMNAPLAVERNTDVTNARMVCDDWGCRRLSRDREWRRERRWERPRWERRRWESRRYWGQPRIYVEPRVIIRPAPRYVVRRSYNAHVRWCLNRYGSYNPQTDTFLSYDGYYKRCISPY